MKACGWSATLASCFARGRPAAGRDSSPDVWEVARLLKDVEGTGDAAVAQAAQLIDLRIDQVEAALSYYVEHRAEVDAWIARLDEYAAREEAAVERRRQALA